MSNAVTIQVHATTPQQMTDLLLFCSSHGISYEVPAAVSFAPEIFDTQLRKPTPLFKEVCGPEWLNPKGLISAAETYRFLTYYVRSRNLTEPDGSIHLNQTLQEALGPGTPTRLFPHQLPGFVGRLLT